MSEWRLKTHSSAEETAKNLRVEETLNPLPYFLRFGVPGGNRTHDLLCRRQSLYPTELRKHIKISTKFLPKPEANPNLVFLGFYADFLFLY